MKRIALLSLLSLFILSACGDDESGQSQSGQGQGQGQQSQQPKDVTVQVIEKQNIALTEELPGRVRAFQVSEIRPQVSGIIQSRMFKEGSFVEEGQQLYQIDPARYEADLARAKASLESAQAELQNAQTVFQRYENLVKSNAISEQEFDDSKARVMQARAAVSLAEAEVQTAEINLGYTKVYAPLSGYIGTSNVTEGALVTAQQEMALSTIRKLDPVYVDLSQAAAKTESLQKRLMDERMSGNGTQSFTVKLVVGDDDTYPQTGTLDATDLAVNEDTGTIRLRSIFPNPNAVLLPGMFVRASIEDIGAQETIIVPQKAAVINPDGSKSVWVVGQDNKAQKRTIVTSVSYENNWVIESGLSEADKVITEGTMMLREGAPVNATNLKDEDEAETDNQSGTDANEGNN